MDNENRELFQHSSQNQNNDGAWQNQSQAQPDIVQNQAQVPQRPTGAQQGVPMQPTLAVPQQQGQRPMPMQGQPRPQGAVPPQQGQRPMPMQGQPRPQGAVPPQQGQRPMPMQGQPRPQGAVPQQQGQRPMQQGQPRPQGAVPQQQGQRPMPMQGQPRPQGAVPQQQGQRPMPMQGQPRPQGAVPQQQGQRPMPMQGQPRPQGAVPAQQGQPMQGQASNPINNESPRQGVVRLFEPEMHDLKQIIRDINAIPNTKTSLYGQCGEVLLAIQTPGLTGQEAVNHAMDIAKQIETSMGTFAYARDRKSLSLCTVELLSSKGFRFAAPDEDTGRLLEQDLNTIEAAHDVFDFGEKSYYNSKMADKILDAALLDDEESPDAAQLASDRSYAAKKCMKTTFGVAIASSQDEQEVGIAVTYGKIVYVRIIENSQNANKAAVLTLMDMLRRLCYGYTIPYAKAFHAGDELDWDDPLEQKGDLTRAKAQNFDVKASKKGGYEKSSEKKSLILPILVLCLVAIALFMGIYYIYNTFIIEDNSALAVGTTSTLTQEDSSIDSATAAPLPTSNQQGEATGENSEAVVHPFAP